MKRLHILGSRMFEKYSLSYEHNVLSHCDCNQPNVRAAGTRVAMFRDGNVERCHWVCRGHVTLWLMMSNIRHPEEANWEVQTESSKNRSVRSMEDSSLMLQRKPPRPLGSTINLNTFKHLFFSPWMLSFATFLADTFDNSEWNAKDGGWQVQLPPETFMAACQQLLWLTRWLVQRGFESDQVFCFFLSLPACHILYTPRRLYFMMIRLPGDTLACNMMGPFESHHWHNFGAHPPPF